VQLEQQRDAAAAAEDEAWKKCMEDMQASWRRDDERKSLERKARKTHAKAMKAMQTTAAVSKVMKDMKASKD
jgi:hypothetical protein